MKRILLFAATVLLSISAATAQPVGNHRPGAPLRCNVSFESQHGEAFTVFIDGDMVNRMPQSRVMVSDVSDQTHEVVVVLKRPAEKAAVLMLRPGEANVTVNVNYDMRQELLYLYTPAYNRPGGEPPSRRRAMDRPVPNGVAEDMLPVEPATRHATDEDVDLMVLQLKAQSFDSERLSLAKSLVSSALFTASQIARLGQTIDFSNSQVEFLKYAYLYCSDPRGYSRAIEILTFSSDRKKVTDYIATQQ